MIVPGDTEPDLSSAPSDALGSSSDEAAPEVGELDEPDPLRLVGRPDARFDEPAPGLAVSSAAGESSDESGACVVAGPELSVKVEADTSVLT